MIIIDEQATGKLIHTLHTLPNRDGRFGLRFRPPGEAAQTRQIVTQAAGRYFPQSDIYFCEDGEIFLLCRDASLKACKQAMPEMAAALDAPAGASELYQLDVQADDIIALLERKIAAQRRAQETLAQRQAQARVERRRQEILGLPDAAGGIDVKRRARATPQLMIIEDDPFSRKLVENVLQKQYPLAALADAQNALSTYAALTPDLLFLDINLPDVTGHELLEKIIALDPQAYVVMLSGNADRDNVLQAMRLGAKGFVAKPFTREKLLQYIDRCPTLRKEPVL